MKYSKSSLKKKIILTLFIFLTLIPLKVLAIDPIALPDFTVLNMSYTPVQSDQLSQDSRWLFLYLSSGCRHCEDIFHAIEMVQDPLVLERIIVIVGGGTPETIKSLIGPREKIASLRWYSDPSWDVYKLLSMSGTPVALGIHKGIVEWSLAGVPWDQQTTGSLLLDWVKY